MYYVDVSAKALRRVERLRKAWYPYAAFRRAGEPGYLYLFDCFAGARGGRRALILLARRIPEGAVKEGDPPVAAPLVPSRDCNEGIVRGIPPPPQPRERPLGAPFEAVDYFAVRMLGVRGAMRRVEEFFKGFVDTGGLLDAIAEELRVGELEFRGVVYQLVAVEGGRVYLAAGGKVERLRVLERFLEADREAAEELRRVLGSP